MKTKSFYCFLLLPVLFTNCRKDSGVNNNNNNVWHKYVALQKGYTYKNNTWVFSSQVTWQHDENCLDSFVLNQQVNSKGVLQNSFQLHTTDYDNGIPHYQFAEIWDSVGNKWVNYEKDTTNYDAITKTSVNISYGWYNNSWQKTMLTTTSYEDDSDHVLHFLVQLWDAVNNTWTDNQRADYTYDVNEKPQTVLFQFYLNGTWYNSALETLSTDVQGHLLTPLIQTWDGSKWVNSTRLNYTFNSDGTVNNYIMQSWDASKSIWKNIQKSVNETFTDCQ